MTEFFEQIYLTARGVKEEMRWPIFGEFFAARYLEKDLPHTGAAPNQDDK